MKKTRLLEGLAVWVMILALASGFIMPVRAATPTIAGSGGNVGSSVTSLTVAFTSVNTGDTLIVVEWLGTTNKPCNYFVTPTDTMGNTYGAKFSCLLDALGVAAIKVYAVNASSTAADTVSCKWAANNTHIASCYVFDVTNPSTLKQLRTNSGTGTTLSVASVAPDTNSVVLAMGGLESACQAVGVSSGFTSLIPASECYSVPYGLSGMTTTTFSVGPVQPTTASMTVSTSLVWAEMLFEVKGSQGGGTTTSTVSCASGSTCTVTTSVIGWNVPNGVTFGNGLVALIESVAVSGVFAGIAYALDYRGDFVVTMAFLGLMAGALLGMMTITSSAAITTPIALLVVATLYTALWLWKGR